MALSVSDLETLETYLNGVMNRSQHHAETVGAVALALIGAVLWKKDNGEPIKVRTRSGSTANVLWVEINGNRYALVYNHRKECIELHERTQTGRVLHRFTNETPVTEVWRVFEGLKPSPV
jgi:CII-binding regulator of phage lambda lysogenization HflD